MAALGSNRSAIRELFEYAKARGAEIGAENIFDFSIGNPSVPPPACVHETIAQLLVEENPTALHGYTSAQGDAGVRAAVAAYLADTFGAPVGADDIYMTCGASASLSITLKALVCPADEVIVFAPFFPEYRVFAESAGATVVAVPALEPDLQIDLAAFRAALSPNTKAVLLNSPNNPSGVVYSRATIDAVCDALRDAAARYGHPIYLLADEPYRELVFDGVEVPFLMNHYDDTIVCYSFSKSLSLPGERIGYIAVSQRAADNRRVYAAVCGAGRALGYVCAPAMMQRVVAHCLGKTADVSVYRRNRDLLCGALRDYGYTVAQPDGAFYLFLKALEPDATAFCERAKKYELLLVPSDSFGCPGYARLAYCVSTDMIERALPAFRALAADYEVEK